MKAVGGNELAKLKIFLAWSWVKSSVAFQKSISKGPLKLYVIPKVYDQLALSKQKQ